MEFHGIDCQGAFLVEDFVSPIWTADDDRRFIRDSVTDTVYIGTSASYVEDIQDINYGTLPSNLKTSLDAKYHILGCSATVFEARTLTVATLTADTGTVLSTSEYWLRLSNKSMISAAKPRR